jgi:hypothetical protein
MFSHNFYTFCADGIYQHCINMTEDINIAYKKGKWAFL